MLFFRTIIIAAIIYLNNSCRSNRSIIINIIIIKAVIKGVAKALRAGIKIYKSRPANSAEYFGIILFVLYSFFKIIRDSGGYP